jgi:hypothetical protein
MKPQLNKDNELIVSELAGLLFFKYLVVLKFTNEWNNPSMMKNRWKIVIACIILTGTTLTCSYFPSTITFSEQEKQATVESLQKTVDAMQKQVITVTSAPLEASPFPTMVLPPRGSISGALFYPEETFPHMRVVAMNIESGEYFATEVVDGNTYVLEGIPEGKFHVLAYLRDPSNTKAGIAGAYTEFVLCGSSEDCKDHTLVEVTVTGDSRTVNINPVDWDADAKTIPPDPTK